MSFSSFHPAIGAVFKDSPQIRVTRLILNDPDISEQGLFVGYSSPTDKFNRKKLSHNLISLWEQGITGKGVVVTVVDDGVFMNHIDLVDNFDQEASFNFLTNTPNPHTVDDFHGTKCIGLISAVANNHICGVGVAFGSHFGAIRILSAAIGEVMDSHEALAFSYKLDHISIFSMSWGPMDNGISMGRPSVLTEKALSNGAMNGRKGLGTIYLFSSGNGGRNFDFCGYDGYLQRYEIFVIGSMTMYSEMPPYAERCTAILASTLSNINSYDENKIYTTEPGNRCGKFHTGTSVSAPIAAGILALVLQVNPNLTRRDIQDLIVRTSIQLDPFAKPNSVGYKYSLNYGFGLLDAHALVAEAKSPSFTPRPELKKCNIPSFNSYKHVEYGGKIQSSLYTSGCMNTLHTVSVIEVVIIRLNVDIKSLKSLSASLKSPSGTITPILESRPLDDSSDGLVDWDIKVMSFYGEKAFGIWELTVSSEYSVPASLKKWSLNIYGHFQQSLNQSKHHSDMISRLCLEKNFLKDSNLMSWCKIRVRDEFHKAETDPYAYSDSENLFISLNPSSTSRYLISSFVIIFGILCLSIFLLFRLYHRQNSSSDLDQMKLMESPSS